MASKKKGLRNLTRAQIFSLIIFLLLILSLPLIVLVVKLRQDYRSRAYTPSATPVVTTTALPQAVLGKRYQQMVSGSDTSGYANALDMTFVNLPVGLAKGQCQLSPAQISCQIIGTPTTSGPFKVIVTLSNGRTGLVSSKALLLLVDQNQ